MEKEFDIEVYRDDDGAYHCVINRDEETLNDTVKGWLSNDTTGTGLTRHATIGTCLSGAWELLKGSYYPNDGRSLGQFECEYSFFQFMMAVYTDDRGRFAVCVSHEGERFIETVDQGWAKLPIEKYYGHQTYESNHRAQLEAEEFAKSLGLKDPPASSSSEAPKGRKPTGKHQPLVPYFLSKLENCKPLWAIRTIKSKSTMGTPMTFDIEVVCVEMGGVHLLVTAPNRGRRYTVEVLFSDVNDKAPELILQNAVDIFLAKTRWGQDKDE